MTTYYVSSEIGSDNNAGTSAAAPFATLQVAANHTAPGDTVLVMNGTYSNGGNDVLTISTSGTAGAPITFEAAPGATPLIDTQGAWQGIEINANYITVRGFTLVGTAGNYTLAQALAGSTPGDPTFNGNGIGVNLNSQNTPHHHIIIENNTIYNMPGAGIATIGADYLQILNNNVHDNAHWSAYGASGISIAASVNFDDAPGPHIIVSGNTSVNNAELVPEYRANAITDGEGIILDSNWGYTGGFLVQNNTTHGNSGPGIETLGSNNAVITGNTTTGDLTNPNLVSEGEIFINQSNNNKVTNNITNIPAPPPAPSGELVINGGFETGDFSGWSQSGNVGLFYGSPQLTITQAAHTGNNAAGFGSIGADGTISQNLTTVAGQTYTFDFWLANMSGGPNDFTAKIGGVTELHLVNDAAQPYTHYTYTFTATSTSTPIEFDFMQQPSEWHLDDVSVAPAGSSPPPPPPPPTPPAPPVIASFSPDTAPVGDGHTTATSITLTGTGEANSTVNVFDGTTSVGHASVNASGDWSLPDSGLTVGPHSFTATDTDANGTSTASAVFAVTVGAPTAPPPPPTSSNLVVNGGFETGDFTGWTASGNVAQLSYGPQLFITSSAHSGQDAAGFGSVGSDGTISQNLTTVVGQSYTLDFWLANAAGGPNDFTAKIGGVTELHLVNAAAQPYTHYDFTFTATSASTPLEFDFRQDPSEWHLDDVSVVQTTGSTPPPPPPTPPAAPVIASFSPDTSPVGDGHTTATSITLTGTGEANSTVNVFDGTTSVGHASVNASSAWSLPASGLTVGPHSFTATDTDANGTSNASAVFAVTVDAPAAPSSSPVAANHLPVVTASDVTAGHNHGHDWSAWQEFHALV